MCGRIQSKEPKMSRWSSFAVIATAGLLSLSGPVAAAGCQAHSRPHRVSVLELYTSEGCSSCPPADRWLSALPQRGIDATMLIPLAFHVDYWNQLGWADRFSQARFSDRQRQIAERLRSGAIYTPQLVLDGRDLRLIGGMDKLQKTLAASNQQPPGAEIDVRVEQGAQGLAIAAQVVVPDAGARAHAEAWIAVFENALSSRVSRGENAGKQLYHDFVVRELAGPFPIDRDGRAQPQHTMRLSTDLVLPNIGVAVFVQRKDNGEFLQATLTPLACRS
jgi:hypothetical protein